jgi:hypothetical protein
VPATWMTITAPAITASARRCLPWVFIVINDGTRRLTAWRHPHGQ